MRNTVLDTTLDFKKIQEDFPILQTKINNKPLIYLDTTATSLKPRQVISAIDSYYKSYSANVFRGIYPISEKATAQYENAREKVAAFINANNANEVVFTRNTSESINLIYYSWALKNIKEGDSITTTIMEHHSNFVPWQQIAEKKKAAFNIWNINQNGGLEIKDLDKLITRKTKLLAITALSNVLGTINSVKDIVKVTKRLNPNCLVLIDGAQWVPHQKTDVKEWGADFVAFSGHKMLGPTGIGVLWTKEELLEKMEPFIYGGEMIREVHTKSTIFKDPPHKFEAGTPHIAGAIGLGAAVDYLSAIGMDNIRHQEEALTSYALNKLNQINEITIFGPLNPKNRGGVIAFILKGVHAHDCAQILADENICVRAGSHCAMPLHEFLGTAATVRSSFYLYTTKVDIDRLVDGLKSILLKFS